MRRGETFEAEIRLRNTDINAWVSAKNSTNGVNVSYHWYAANKRLVTKEGFRTLLPENVEPGATIQMPFQIVAPDRPGEYLLRPDLVHEGIAWFSDAIDTGPSFKVTVT
jgi:hypothetical protein